MKQLTLQPIRSVNGEINLPGSKSMSNRVLLLAALARGATEVRNLLASDDTTHMLNALRTLGAGVALSDDGARCLVTGLGGAFPAGEATLFMGNSGTTMRSLCAALCAGYGRYTLTGEPRMLERPIGDLVDALRQVGARIEYAGAEGYPPLRIDARGLAGGSVRIRGSISSQYLTGMLMAAPMSLAPLTIEVEGELVSKPYIDMTIDVMRRFGVEVERNGYESFRLPGGQRYESPGSILVEGDASSASYFLSAAAIGGGAVRVNGVGGDSIQGDIAHADVLRDMGAIVSRGADWIEVSRGELTGIDADLNHMPDAAMTVAVTALFAKGETTIRNIHNWRVKETDRLSAMATELRKVGADVVEGADYIRIIPPTQIRQATIDTYDDHRIAMCFSLAALGNASITINDPDTVSKTFPDYFERLQQICRV